MSNVIKTTSMNSLVVASLLTLNEYFITGVFDVGHFFFKKCKILLIIRTYFYVLHID